MRLCEHLNIEIRRGWDVDSDVYQLMANELKIGHVKVASFYALLQLAVSFGFVCLCPVLEAGSGLSLVAWHWIYLVVALVVLAVAYVVFMRSIWLL